MKGSFFTRYELPLFFLLTYPLSWWSIPVAGGAIIPQGPALAAVIVIALTAGRPGLREFWKRLTNFRAGWWFLIGPAIIAAFLLAAYAISLLMGVKVTNPFHLPSVGTLVTLLLLGGLWEEPGWTGFAFHKLQERFTGRPYGALTAALITGTFRALWHLPLVISGSIAWHDAVFYSYAIQILLAWIYNRSGKSIPAVMLTHYASNVLAGSIMLQAFAGSDKALFYILLTICGSLAGLLIALGSRLKLGYAPSEA